MAYHALEVQVRKFDLVSIKDYSEIFDFSHISSCY